MQEFDELDLLLSREYQSIPIKYGNVHFFGSYFKAYFRRLLSDIDHPLIPKGKLEVHDTLDGLPEAA